MTLFSKLAGRLACFFGHHAMVAYAGTASRRAGGYQCARCGRVVLP